MYYGKKFSDIEVGDKAQVSKTITEFDVYAFAGITGDLNPVHIDEEACKKTKFQKRIAHGALSNGLISATLSMHLPGPGSIYLSQNSKFIKPVYFGDTLTAIVEVKEKIETKGRLIMKTIVMNQNNDIVLDGEAIVMKE